MSSVQYPHAGGDVDIGYRLTTIVCVSISLATIAVSLRIYARAKIVRKVGLDDWLILLAVLLGLLASVTEEIGVYYGGIGRHSFYLTPKQKLLASKYSVISQAFCIMALCVAKISICISLLRILQGSRAPWTRGTLWGTVVLQFVVNTGVMMCLLLQCRPTQKIWNQALHGSCWNPIVFVKLAQLQGGVAAFSDWSLSLIPIWIIKNLHLDKRNKVILCILMGLGIITGICAIVRTVYLIPYFDQKDPTYTNVNLLIWAGLERNIACIVACVPACRPLGKQFVQMVSHTSSRYRTRRTGYSEQSGQHELSKVRNRSKFVPGTKDSLDQNQSTYHLKATATAGSARSEESTFPLQNNNAIRATTTVRMDTV
ncbi:hypothetical protein BCON_0974g00020 [Botryotinia convoluta]|uniref:Rhodopsin domain-containing protein n=1 Tax=Botryotinia convoluta TaxID=54673 RepID=A0A4Z1HF38_9HELO|nr:hypothetical protein BCON_0974g00020 [Botryotinia convoluta]